MPALGAVLLLLLYALPAGAVPVRWAIADAPYRAVVKLNHAPAAAEAGIAITLPEFGATLPQLTDVVLTDADGAIQPLAVAWRGEGQEALLLAKGMNQEQDYYVYFGGGRPASGMTWLPKISLLMETRRLPGGGEFDSWNKLETAWRNATEVDGAMWVRSIYQGVNPFGENSHFLTHYTGYLRTEKAKELTLYTISSDASFVLVDGKFEFGWPGEHSARADAKTVPNKTVSCTGPLTRIDYYHVKAAKGQPAMVLGWRLGEKYDAIPDDAWAHPGSTTLVRIEQAQGLPVPVANVKVLSYIGYANQWLYEVHGELADDPPEGWTVQWKFADGLTTTQREFTRVVSGGKSQFVSVKLQRGREEVTGKRRLTFSENIPAASVKSSTDLDRYLAAIARENPADLPAPALRNYLTFLQSISQEQRMGRLADAWLRTRPEPADPLWLPAQLSRLREIAQTDPGKALIELRNIPANARGQHAGALDLFELELLVFYLADPVAVTRATQISMRDPKSEVARLALVRAGDFYRLQGRYAEAIQQYQQAQRSVVEESAGRKLPAQDRAFSITINDLLEGENFPEAQQKLTEWEATHPLAKLDSDFLILRGRILMTSGRWREALAEIESFEKLQPESPFQIDADFYRARALYELGQKDAARKIWAEIAKTYPQHALANASAQWAAKR